MSPSPRMHIEAGAPSFQVFEARIEVRSQERARRSSGDIDARAAPRLLHVARAGEAAGHDRSRERAWRLSAAAAAASAKGAVASTQRTLLPLRSQQLSGGCETWRTYAMRSAWLDDRLVVLSRRTRDASSHLRACLIGSDSGTWPALPDSTASRRWGSELIDAVAQLCLASLACSRGDARLEGGDAAHLPQRHATGSTVVRACDQAGLSGRRDRSPCSASVVKRRKPQPSSTRERAQQAVAPAAVPFGSAAAGDHLTSTTLHLSRAFARVCSCAELRCGRERAPRFDSTPAALGQGPPPTLSAVPERAAGKFARGDGP
jgi:hypothetical protein